MQAFSEVYCCMSESSLRFG